VISRVQNSLSNASNLYRYTLVANVSVAGGPADAAVRAGVSDGTGTRFELDDDITVTVDEGQTMADVLRDAGADPGVLSGWMRDGDSCDHGGGHTEELFTRFEEVLFESYTYLES
jgi:hypothetical protein